MFTEMIKGVTVTNSLTESQKLLNESTNEAKKAYKDETVELKSNLAIAKDYTLDKKDRLIAVDKLIKQYPYFFEGLTKEEILAGKTEKAERKLTDALLARAKSTAAMTKIQAEQSKIIDIDEEIYQLKQKLTQAEIANADAVKNVIKVNRSRGDGEAFQAVQTAGNVEEIKKKISQQEKEKKALEEVVNRITQYVIANDKAAIGLDYQTEKSNENTRAIKLNTKAREDYLASEYELWRLRKQNESDRNKEIMKDEASGYELRLMASEQYYENELDLANRAAQEELRVLKFTTDERIRTSENEFINSKEQLDAWLRDSKISRSQYNKGIKDAEEQLQYDRDGIIKDATNKQNIIYENQAQRLIELNRELVGEMERAWNEINFGKADVLIDERSLKGFEDLGKLLKGIGEDMPIGEIKTRLAEINRIQEEHNRTIRRAELQVELDRAEAEKRRIERAIETDGRLNNLTEDQIQSQKYSNKTLIDLDKEIIKSKEAIAKADNEVTQVQIDNALKLKEAKLEAQIQLGQELGNLANQLFDNTVSYYDREIEKSNEYYDALLENAESGSEQEQMLQEEKQRKEEELQKRKIAIQRKQAIFNKFLSLADIAMNLQSEIAKNNATLGTIAAQPVNAFAIASAAVRTATVLATPLPQYKDGRGKGKDEFAIVGDGGRSEVIERGSGKLEVTPNVPTITHLGKDDIVHKSLEDFERSKLAIQNASIMASFGSQSRQLEMFDYYLGKELRGISNKIEKGIEKGFKKAKIQNYIKMPPIDIGHIDYKNRGLT